MGRQESAAPAVDGVDTGGLKPRQHGPCPCQRTLRSPNKKFFMRAPNVLRLLVYSLTIGFGLSACNADSEIVNHAFEFDALHDSPGIQILNYQYGESKAPGARNPDYLIKEGRSAQRTAISGPMKRPNALYVKWRVLADGKVYEDTVDLRDRLPRNLNDCIVYFIVKGPQLHVYLISQTPHVANATPDGPPQYRRYNVLTIYP